MKTINTTYKSQKDLQEFIKSNALEDSKNILLQVFTAIVDEKYIRELIESVKELIPDVKILGATTDGEILGGEVLSNSTILSFSIFENTTIKTYHAKNKKTNFDSAYGLMEQFEVDKKPKVAISFVDGLNVNGENFLKVLDKYHKDLIVVGGLAGDNATFTKTLVFTEEEILQNGAVIALLYNDDLVVNTQASFGWESLGKRLTITKAKQNIVYEIDGIKAVDIYAKYLGQDVADSLPTTGIEFPLIVQRENLKIPRAVVGKNSDGSLVFAGNLIKGDSVTFGYGNVEMILHGEEKVYHQTISKPVESIFVYSCMARKALLGDSIKNELSALSNIGSLSGFFTYGEFFKNKSYKKAKFLNQTMTILALSETKESVQKDKYYSKNAVNMINPTLKALSHLIQQTTHELDEINSTLEVRVEKEVEKNIQKDKQLLEQSRLAQMGEMIGMIAHQWRQPLTAISSSANTLSLDIMMDNYDKEFFEEQVNHIAEYSQHLSSTIDDFRNFFKQKKEKQSFPIEEIVDNTMSIIGSSLDNKGIVLEKDFQSNQDINSHPNELKQVVLNLIKNAEDILLEKEIEYPWIKIKTFVEDNKVVLTVEDNAGGVPEDIKDKIFDPYFSTKLEKDGTGLGLYMSKTIIEEHCKGTLSVSNSKNGAVFKIKMEFKDE